MEVVIERPVPKPAFQPQIPPGTEYSPHLNLNTTSFFV